MDIGTLTGSIDIEDELSGKLEMISHYVEKWVDGFDESMKFVAESAGVVTVAIAGMTASIIALGNKGSDINRVDDTLVHFTGSAEAAEEVIKRMSEGVKGTVGDFELAGVASKILGARVKLTAEQFGELSDAAMVMEQRGLGPARQNLDLISMAMITGRTRSLAMKLGVVETKDATADFAKSLGTTKDRLNELGVAEGKRLGVLNLLKSAVTETALKERDFGEQMHFAVVQVEEWGDKLAARVAKLPALSHAVEAIGEAIQKSFGGIGETATDVIIEGITKFATVVGVVAPKIIAFMGDVKDVVMEVGKTLLDLNETLGASDTVVSFVETAWKGLTATLEGTKSVVTDVVEEWKSLPEGVQLGVTIAVSALTLFLGTLAAVDAASNILLGTLGTLWIRLSTYPVVVKAVEFAIEASAVSTAFWSTVLKGLSAQLAASSLATYAFAAAQTITSAAGRVLIPVLLALQLNYAALVARIGLATSATWFSTAALQASTVASIALGTALQGLLLVVLPLAVAWAAWKFGEWLSQFPLLQRGVLWLAEHLHIISTETANARRELLGLSDTATHFGGNMQEGFRSVDPVVAALQDKMVETGKALGKTGTDLDDFVNHAVERFTQLRDSGKTTAANVTELDARFIALAHSASLPIETMKELANEARELQAHGAKLTPVLQSLILQFPDLEGAAAAGAGGASKFLKTGSKDTDDFKKKVDDLTKSLVGVNSETEVFGAAFSKLTPKQLAQPEIQERIIPKIDATAEASQGQLSVAMKAVYTQALANQQVVIDLAHNELVLKNVTLDTIEAKKQQGMSEAQIARSYDVTTKALQAYQQELTGTRKVTDDLVKAQDALTAAQNASDVKGVASAATAAQQELQKSYDAGLISAQNFASQRLAIEEASVVARLQLEGAASAASEAAEQRDLAQRIARGELFFATAEQLEQMRTNITLKYSIQRGDAEQAEMDRRRKIQGEGHDALIKIQKQYQDTVDKGTLTATQYQSVQIDHWAMDTKAAYKGAEEDAQAYYDEVDRLAERQKRDLTIDNQALTSNSRQALEEVATKARNTYAAMAADPEHYSKVTRDHFRQIVIDADDAAKGVTHAWRSVFEQIPDILRSAFEGGGGVSGALKSLAILIGTEFGKELDVQIKRQLDVLSEEWSNSALSSKTIKLAAGAGITAGVGAATSGGTTGQQLGTSLSSGLGIGMSAFASGASVASSLALGAVTFGVSAAIVGIVALVKHLNEGRKAVEDFAKSFGGFDELHTQLNKLGSAGEQMWIKLTQSGMSKKEVEAYGQTIQKTLADLDADVSKYGLSWDDVGDAQTQATKSATALLASYDRLTKAGFSTDKVIQAMSGDLNHFITTSVQAGTRISAAMRPVIESFLKTGQVTQDTVDAIMGVKSGIPPLEDIKAAADRYGISLDQLGPKVKQLEINQTAAQYVADWKTLTSATDDWGAIIDAMGPKVQDLVSDAMKYSLQLPFAMKPMIQSMIDAGKLVDQNGEKLTDLSKLTFAEDLSAMFETLMGKLDQLIDKITDGVGGALDSLGNKVVSPKIAPQYVAPEDGTQAAPMMTGGPVYAATGYAAPVSHGSDTKLAMLSPGEGVLTTTGMGTIGAAGLAAANTGNLAGVIVGAIGSASQQTAQLTATLKALQEQQAQVARASFTIVQGFKDQASESTALQDELKKLTTAASDTVDLRDVFPNIKPWSEQVGTSIGHARGEIQTLSGSLKGDVQQSVGQFTGSLEDLSNSTTAVAGTFHSSFKNVKESVDGPVGSVDTLDSSVQGLARSAGSVAGAFDGSFSGVKGSIDGSVVSSDTLRGSVQGLGGDAQGAATDVMNANSSIGQSYTDATGSADILRGKVVEIVDENGNVVRSLDVAPWSEWSSRAGDQVKSLISQIDVLIAKAATASQAVTGIPAAPATTSTTPQTPTPPIIVTTPTTPAPSGTSPDRPGPMPGPNTYPRTPGPIPGGTTPGPIPGGTTPGPQRTIGAAPPPPTEVTTNSTTHVSFDFTGATFGDKTDAATAGKLAAAAFFESIDNGGPNRTKMTDVVRELQASDTKMRRIA